MTARLAGGPWIYGVVGGLCAVTAYVTALNPLIAIGCFAAAILVYIVLTQAETMLLILVAAMPWEDLLLFPSETVSAVKILGLLLGVAYLLRTLAGRAPLQTTKALLAVVLFVALTLVSLLLSPDPSAGIAKTLRYVLFGTFFFLVVQLVPTRAGVLRVIRVFVLSVAAAGIYGLFIFFQDILIYASGPIGDPDDFGYLLVATLPLAIFLLVSERNRRWLWTVCSVIIFATMLATLSRGALAGLAAMAVWAVATRRVPIAGAAAAVVMGVGVLLLAFAFASPILDERIDAKQQIGDQNVASRLAFWSAATYMAADHPLTGVGPARFGIEGTRTYIRSDPSGLQNPVAHNAYLEILAENGILATLAFLAFLLGTWITLGRVHASCVHRGDSLSRSLVSAIQASLIVAVVSGLFLSAQVSIPLWIVGGLAMALARDPTPYIDADVARKNIRKLAGPRRDLAVARA